MANRIRRGRRKPANVLHGTERPTSQDDPIDKRIARHVQHERGLLERILENPHVAQVVPRLQPEVLHRVIQTCGLEDCSDLVALTTPAQLQQVFDLDLWRPAAPGLDEQFDADRFAVWLDVLMESGAQHAAQTLAGIDPDLVIAALAEHVLVFDRAAVAPFTTTDGEEMVVHRSRGDRLGCEIGCYSIEARRTNGWDTIVAVLLSLDSEQPDYFHRVMRGCRKLSSSGRELDGLHGLLEDRDQDMFDLTVDRERRREKQGYVTSAEARAFLDSARQLRRGHSTPPPPNPIARAYFRAIDSTSAPDPAAPPGRDRPAASESPDVERNDADSMAAVVEILRVAGVLENKPRALLEGPGKEKAARFARIETQMELARSLDYAAYSMRTEEYAYLANALAAGCSIQTRPFTEREACDAVLAVCNLGLENWPQHWLAAKGQRGSSGVEQGLTLPDDFLVGQDLVSVFQIGWTVLYDDVCMYAAGQLVSALSALRCRDAETQSALVDLRFQMKKQWQAGTPWHAREALDVIAILDLPAWAALLGLIDECPVLHAGISASRGSGIRAVGATAFEFISENRQIVAVREFMQSLPATLGP